MRQKSRRRRSPKCSTQCVRSEEHTSELQSLAYLVCRLLLEKKKSPHSLGVVLVSQELERRCFRGNAIGPRLRFSQLWLAVIGVARDAQSRQLTDAAPPACYL